MVLGGFRSFHVLLTTDGLDRGKNKILLTVILGLKVRSIFKTHM